MTREGSDASSPSHSAEGPAFGLRAIACCIQLQDCSGATTIAFMSDRVAPRVTVPDVVGLPFHVGRDIAADAGVTLANPDPDGPPIGALAWPGLFYITSQSPPAGTELYRWDSVVDEIVEHGVAQRGAVRELSPPPWSDVAHATPTREQFLDLTETTTAENEPDSPR